MKPFSRRMDRAEDHVTLAQRLRPYLNVLVTFLNDFIGIPCQIVRGGRRLIYRVLSYNPNLPVFFRLCTVLRC